MSSRDSWSLDPTVGRLRKIFALLEARQDEVLTRLAIPSLDPRVRLARELARQLWERAWARANYRGSEVEETQMADLYEYAFILAFRQQGVGPPI
ncbi:MAG: hypothetical protein EHM75_01135, partial [Desulfobacteraceae bacterium]